MKKLILPIMTFLFSSCAVTNYYQVYKTNFESGTLKYDKILFEDKNCIVSYDLWTNGGDIGFNIFNKTEGDLTVNLAKTFFVLNGIAFEYFQNRTFSKSSYSGTTATYSNPYAKNYSVTKAPGAITSSSSITYNEKSELSIPPKTSINISEYHISNFRYVSCDLAKYPSGKNIKTLNFDKTNSPFIFYNIITYSTEFDTLRLENKFYVSEITNYPSTKMFTQKDTSSCGEKLLYPIEVFKNSSPDKFYIKYLLEN